ncbi:MAG: hypothetical protein JRH19_20235, partial [Deltaproteobacteria bacterium]|nr:hypothetical protein [Deltaproteobacteria bacterium]
MSREIPEYIADNGSEFTAEAVRAAPPGVAGVAAALRSAPAGDNDGVRIGSGRSLEAGQQGSDQLLGEEAKTGRRLTEAVTCASASVILILFAFAMQPHTSGDGPYYFGMLEGLARNGSPALTDAVLDDVRDRFDYFP